MYNARSVVTIIWKDERDEFRASFRSKQSFEWFREQLVKNPKIKYIEVHTRSYTAFDGIVETREKIREG